MKLAWVKWASPGGTETRDDGYKIYHNVGFVMLQLPDQTLRRFPTAEEAKRYVDELVYVRQTRP